MIIRVCTESSSDYIVEKIMENLQDYSRTIVVHHKGDERLFAAFQFRQPKACAEVAVPSGIRKVIIW